VQRLPSLLLIVSMFASVRYIICTEKRDLELLIGIQYRYSFNIIYCVIITPIVLDGNQNACPGGNQDPLWSIEWDFTVADSRDIKPCPQTQGIQTFGMHTFNNIIPIMTLCSKV
jgi:hypothetical protein